MTKVIDIKQANIIETKKPEKYNFCSHDHLLADKHKRILECSECGKLINPFDYLWRLATENDRMFENRKLLREEISELRKQVDELKRQERNTKSRLKRANKKESQLT